MENSSAYNEKKKNFERQITVYGRNVVLEILEEKDINITKVHLADSNKKDGVVAKIESLCEKKFFITRNKHFLVSLKMQNKIRVLQQI